MSTELTPPEYSAMVSDLAKPGAAIISSLTIQKAHLWHMLTGLAGEIAELLEPCTDLSVTNAVEELGDIEFYFEGFCQAFGMAIEADTGRDDLRMKGRLIVWMDLYRAFDTLFDKSKKFIIYCKEVSPEDFRALLTDLRYRLDMCYRVLNITREQALEYNQQKLLKGDKARYKEGTYSDDQAQARADKQENK